MYENNISDAIIIQNLQDENSLEKTKEAEYAAQTGNLDSSIQQFKEILKVEDIEAN